MPGEFTMRFDKDILKSTIAEQQKKELEKQKEQKEQDRITQDLNEVGKLLERRAPFLKDRFPNAVPDKFEGLGFKVNFTESGDKKAASFTLATKTNESRLAIRVESTYEIPSKKVKKYDYVDLTTDKKVDLERAKRFIEQKLMDFAKDYVG